jgi:hypothetical protein
MVFKRPANSRDDSSARAPKRTPKGDERRKKLPVQDTINRHLPEQNQRVVNSKEIIMATNLPVAGENLRLQVSHIAAGQTLTTDRKGATAQSLPAREKAIHPNEKAVILTGKALMTVIRAVSAVAKRKVSNQEIHHTQAGQLLMINPKETSMANHPAKKGPM